MLLFMLLSDIISYYQYRCHGMLSTSMSWCYRHDEVMINYIDVMPIPMSCFLHFISNWCHADVMQQSISILCMILFMSCCSFTLSQLLINSA